MQLLITIVMAASWGSIYRCTACLSLSPTTSTCHDGLLSLRCNSVCRTETQKTTSKLIFILQIICCLFVCHVCVCVFVCVCVGVYANCNDFRVFSVAQHNFRAVVAAAAFCLLLQLSQHLPHRALRSDCLRCCCHCSRCPLGTDSTWCRCMGSPFCLSCTMHTNCITISQGKHGNIFKKHQANTTTAAAATITQAAWNRRKNVEQSMANIYIQIVCQQKINKTIKKIIKKADSKEISRFFECK